jgi:hypothetical protein
MIGANPTSSFFDRVLISCGLAGAFSDYLGSIA